ncbi:MAG: DUF1330 domain-containing protein [Pararhizobium sp.]
MSIFDADSFEDYKREVPATEQRYVDRYLARGGATKALEGDWEPHRPWSSLPWSSSGSQTWRR